MSGGIAPVWLAARFESFAARECAGISPLYQALSRGTAGSAELLDLAARAGPGQPAPNLLLASVHFLLLRSRRDHPLAGFYASLTERPAPPDEAFPAFVDFCRAHARDIAALLSRRAVSTNEVQRCACLLPAFAAIARESPEPLQMIEIGTSAGFNLLWDLFGYDYGAAGRLIPDHAPLVLRCAPRGVLPPPLPKRPPAVGRRVGIDTMPLDPGDPDDTLWLRALVWPEQRCRAERLEKALALARAERPSVQRGDGAERLEALAASMPAEGTLCLYHSFTRNQMSPAKRAAFAAAMTRVGATRPLFQVALEWGEAEAPELVITRYQDGMAESRRLALCDAHGAWLEWLAEALPRERESP